MAGQVRLFEKREDGSLSEVVDQAKIDGLRAGGYVSRMCLEIDVAWSDSEILARQAEVAEAQKAKAEKVAESQRQEALQTSAMEKLAALGLSEDEIKAVTGSRS